MSRVAPFAVDDSVTLQHSLPGVTMAAIEIVCMDIKFTCEFCGQHIVIDESGVGITVSCPKCSCELVVPTSEFQIPAKPPVESSPPEPATDKQIAYLRDLGVGFAESVLTKKQASTLIEGALAKRPPTQRQKDKLQRLGLLDDLEEDATALEASQLLTWVLDEQPTDAQLARAKEIGLRLTKIDNLTAGALDDIIKLEDRQPDHDKLTALKAYGFTDFSGTAYGAQMLLELADQYITDFEWDLSKNEIGRACLAAIKDPSFYKPTFRDGNFKWPKTKMREWSSGHR